MKGKDTVNTTLFPLALLVGLMFLPEITFGEASQDEYDEDQIELIEGEDRLIYEYRQNGMLTMIKIVPKKEIQRSKGLICRDTLDHFYIRIFVRC